MFFFFLLLIMRSPGYLRSGSTNRHKLLMKNRIVIIRPSLSDIDRIQDEALKGFTNITEGFYG